MPNHKYPGFFVSFEGIDYCGKTTQYNRFVNHATQQGWDLTATREPGAGLPAAEEIRRIILAAHLPTLPLTDLLLFCAARYECVNKIVLPTLLRGALCILDRYADSTEAYQGHGAGLPLHWVYEINELATGGIWPDITFFIDREPKECLEAMLKSEDRRLDAMEGVDLLTLTRRRCGFEQAMKRSGGRIVRIPFRNDDPDAMEVEIWEQFYAAMKARNYEPKPAKKE